MTAGRAGRRALAAVAVLGLAACQAPPGPQRFVGTGNPYEPVPLPPRVTVVHPPLGDAQAEVRELEARRDRAPDDVRAHLAYVAGLTRLGRRAQARAHYATRAQGADARPVEQVMAARLMGRGGSSALRRVYAAAAQREPENPWWPLGLAEVELREAQAFDGLRQDARRRSDQDAEREAYDRARAAVARAEGALARALALPGAPPERYLYLGHLRALEGDLARQGTLRTAAYEASAAAFERAVAEAPDLVEAWEGLGDVRHRLGATGESLRAFLEAAQRSPGDGRLREALGVALHQVGREREAAEQYAAAAALLTHAARPLLRLGDALAAQERWAEALAAWDQAIERDAQGAVEAYARQAAVYEHLGRFEEARLAYERYVEGGGERTSYARRRIERLLRGGRP